MKIKVLLVTMLFCNSTIFSQEASEQSESLKGNHRLTFGLGHTHLAQGQNKENKTVWLVEPSWSLNYDYWIANKWAIGIQSDMVLEKFIIKDGQQNELEREYPVAVIAVAIYKPFKHFSFIAGPGMEFEKSENLFLTRLGAEYGCELPKGWEAGIALMWDEKWSHYSSWVFEFSFSKNFKRKK